MTHECLTSARYLISEAAGDRPEIIEAFLATLEHRCSPEGGPSIGSYQSTNTLDLWAQAFVWGWDARGES